MRDPGRVAVNSTIFSTALGLAKSLLIVSETYQNVPELPPDQTLKIVLFWVFFCLIECWTQNRPARANQMDCTIDFCWLHAAGAG